MDFKSITYGDIVNTLFLVFMAWNIARAYHFIP